jgi:uncharacterized protein (PEP-CTERM system associated)
LKLVAITVTGMERLKTPSVATLSSIGFAISLLTLSLGATAQGFGSLADPQNLPQSPTDGSAEEVERRKRTATLLPGVRTSLSYSSNVNLESDTLDANGKSTGSPQRSGDFVLEITPYVRAESEAQRLKYKLDYSLSNLYRFRTNEKIIARHRFQGNVTAALSGDWLWLDATGLIANTYADLFAPLAVDPNVSFTNVAQIRSLSLSPYIRTRLLGIADGTFRYGLQWNGNSSNAVEQSKFIHVLSADLRGSEVDGRNWNWSWSGEHTIRKFGNVDIRRNFSIASGYWVPTPSVRLTGSAVYDQIDGLTARNGKRKGLGPGIGLDWSPYEQGQIKINAINRYYGNSYNVAISHVSNQLIATFNASKGASGSVDSSILSVDPGSVFGTGSVTNNPLYRALIAQNLRLGFGIPYGAGLIDDTYILETRAGLSLGVNGIRNSLTLNLFGTRRDTSLFVTAIPSGASGPRGGGVGFSGRFNGLVDVASAALDYKYKFDARSNLSLSLTHLQIDSPTVGSTSKSTSLTAGVTTKLTPDAQVGAGLRRSEGSTTGLVRSKFDDTAIFGTLDVRF